MLLFFFVCVRNKVFKAVGFFMNLRLKIFMRLGTLKCALPSRVEVFESGVWSIALEKWKYATQIKVTGCCLEC